MLANETEIQPERTQSHHEGHHGGSADGRGHNLATLPVQAGTGGGRCPSDPIGCSLACFNEYGYGYYCIGCNADYFFCGHATQ